MSPIIQEILRIARELLNVPTIVCMAACLIGLIVAIICKKMGNDEVSLSFIILIYIFPFAVIAAIIAMLFFHVPFSKIASVANIVLLVLLPFCSINLIFFAPETMAGGKAGRVRDKYNLWKPVSLCKTVVFMSAILGLIFVIVTFLVALIAEWLFKVEAEQVGSARDIRLFWIVAFNIVLFISCLIIDLIRMGIYTVKLHIIKVREKAAHTSFDPIILEANTKVFEYLFGVAVVVSAIALIIHVPLDQVVRISIIVTLGAYFIVIIASVVSALRGSGKDRYGISMPPEKNKDNEKIIGYIVVPGVCSMVYAFYIAIISMIFFKQPLGSAFGLFLKFLLLGVGYAIIMFIILKPMDIIVHKVYEAKLKKVKSLEKIAHAVCDPIMLEAIEKNDIEFRNNIVAYCKDKSPKGKCQQFLKYYFFFDEGLSSLQSSGKIKSQYVTGGQKDNNTYLYYITDRETDAHRTWDPVMRDIVNNSGGLLEAYQVKEKLKQQCEKEKLDLPNKKFVYYVNSFVANGLDSLVSEGKLVLKTPKKGDKVLRLYQSTCHNGSEEISLD